MSFKDLYSEVKKRKMEALGKKEIVDAVEKHGKILGIKGRFEDPKKVISHMYASEKVVIKPRDILKTDLTPYDVVYIGCPGSEIPSTHHIKFVDYVDQGGWLITTDWALKFIVETCFPGFIKWNGNKTSQQDAIVKCEIMNPDHPFLAGVTKEISQDKFKKAGSGLKSTEFRWWLEKRSFPIVVLNGTAVRVLISSWQLKNNWGSEPVLVEFGYGNKGGRVVHMISHAHLQKGGEKGKYASALIFTNILDEVVAQKKGIKRKGAPSYVDASDALKGGAHSPKVSQVPLEDQWVMSSSEKAQYLTPSSSDSGLTGTAQVEEISVNDSSFSYSSKCVSCDFDFGDHEGKVYRCKGCKGLYHNNCLKIAMTQGTCPKCNKILLW